MLLFSENKCGTRPEQNLVGNGQSEIALKCSTCKLTPSKLAIVNYSKKGQPNEQKYIVAPLQIVREHILSLTPYGEAPVMLQFGEMWSTTSLPLLPGPLWSRVVAPDRVLSMDQIEL